MSSEGTTADGRERRLEAVLASCLDALERGQAPDRQELLARYPEFTAELEEFLAGREQLDRLAAPLRAIAPPPGTCVRYFGDYELLEEIARGGMGVVYRARQLSLN